MNETKISEILECLKKSPTFNMSRGGRELFHTNFLAFILDAEHKDDCKSYEAEVKRLILQQLFGVENTPKNVITFRERSNLDLIIVPALGQPNNIKKVVIIEAKLKSIPTFEQLEKYNRKFESGLKLELFEEVEIKTNNRKNLEYEFSISGISLKLSKTILNSCSLILISEYKNNDRPCELVDVTLCRFLLAPKTISTIKLEPWILIDWYQFLVDITNELSSFLPEEKSIFGQLIEDYINSTMALLDLVKQVNERCQEFFQETISWSDFLTFAVNRNDFKRMRLHDLVGKVAYHSLQNRLIRDLEQDKELNKTYEGFKLDSYTFYSRSQAGIGIQYKMYKGKQAFSLGIQLQGNDYRHFIERNNCINPEDDLIACANIIKSWICINKKDAKGKKNNGFGVFDKTKFVYQHIKLGSSEFNKFNDADLANKSLKYSDLLNKIKLSLNEAIKEIGNEEFLSKFVGKATLIGETQNGV